jgi:LysM repeat protein
MPTHTIVSGDTFWNLAQQYRCSLQAIQDANPGVTPNQLQIGQVIQLPGGGGRSSSSRENTSTSNTSTTNRSTHTIVSGDTFWNLAQQYRCSPQAIQDANPGVTPNQLRIGQEIQLPRGGERSTSSTAHGSSAPTGNTPSKGRMDTTLNGRVPVWCEPLRNMINAAAQETKVPADLIAAVIYQESDGNIDINATENPNGGSDSGVMQVNEYTARTLEQNYPDRFRGIRGLARNIMLGASYLRYMFDTIGDHDWSITLRAYNSGPNGVDKRNLRATPAGTGDSTYVDKVLACWSDISSGKVPAPDHYASKFP